MKGEHRDRMEGDKHTQRKGRLERVKKGRERERERERSSSDLEQTVKQA